MLSRLKFLDNGLGGHHEALLMKLEDEFAKLNQKIDQGPNAHVEALLGGKANVHDAAQDLVMRAHRRHSAFHERKTVRHFSIAHSQEYPAVVAGVDEPSAYDVHAYGGFTTEASRLIFHYASHFQQ
jgi:hypothetical protein